MKIVFRSKEEMQQFQQPVGECASVYVLVGLLKGTNMFGGKFWTRHLAVNNLRMGSYCKDYALYYGQADEVASELKAIGLDLARMLAEPHNCG